jgi:alanine-synthesizing transaminase
VAIDALRHGIDLDPARIVLTASTSEAYGFLFKLLCDPGDEVLVPRPSYPLFEHLSSLDGVRALPYTLDYYGRWSIDVDGLARAITRRTRAILVVSPNNPTGSCLSAGELDALAALCEQHDLALIGDEVFAEYTLNDVGGPPRSADAAGLLPCVSVLTQQRALTFCLGGLSKSIGLPQVKLGWIGIGGPDALVGAALDRLDLIADTYLSVSTPVQLAAPLLIERGHGVRTQIQARIEANLRALERAVARAPGCTLLRPEAGWTAVLRVPATRAEEDLVLDLLEEDRVLIMPGYFYDFPREAYLVVSLLPDPAVFNEAVARVLARAEAEPRG